MAFVWQVGGISIRKYQLFPFGFQRLFLPCRQIKIPNIMAKDKSPAKEKDKKAPVKNLKEKRAEKKIKKTAKKSTSSN